MQYSDLIRDFADRARRNYKLVGDHAHDGSGTAFEVTQLICSLLAVIVLPKERDIGRIPAVSWSDFEQRHELNPRVRTGSLQDTCLRDVVKKLRHAIAHFNIEFLDSSGEITAVRFWNVPCGNPNHERDFDVEFPVRDLERLYFELSNSLGPTTTIESSAEERHQ